MSHPDSESLYDVATTAVSGRHLGSILDASGTHAFDAVALASGETVFVSPTEVVGDRTQRRYGAELPWRTGGTVAEDAVVLTAAADRRFLGIAFTPVLHKGQDSRWTVRFRTNWTDGVEPAVTAAVVWQVDSVRDVAALVEDNGVLALETYDEGVRIGRAFVARSEGRVDNLVVTFERDGRDVTVLEPQTDGTWIERARLARAAALAGAVLRAEARVTNGNLTVGHVHWAVAPDLRYGRAPRLNRYGLAAAAGDQPVGLSIDNMHSFFESSPDSLRMLEAHGTIVLPGFSAGPYTFQKGTWETERWRYDWHRAGRHQLEASLAALGIRYLSGVTADKDWVGGPSHPGYQDYMNDILAPHKGDARHGVVLIGAVDHQGNLISPDLVTDLARRIRENSNVPYIHSGESDYGFQICDRRFVNRCLAPARNFANIHRLVPDIGGAVVVYGQGALETDAPLIDETGDEIVEMLRREFDDVIFGYTATRGEAECLGRACPSPQPPGSAYRAITRLATRHSIPLAFRFDGFNFIDDPGKRRAVLLTDASFTYVPNGPYYRAVFEELEAARRASP